VRRCKLHLLTPVCRNSAGVHAGAAAPVQRKAKPAAQRHRKVPAPAATPSDLCQQGRAAHSVVLQDGFLHEQLGSRIKYVTLGTSPTPGKALLPCPASPAEQPPGRQCFLSEARPLR